MLFSIVSMLAFHFAVPLHANALTCDELASKKCLPCEGGVDPLSRDEATSQLLEVPGWALTEQGEGVLSIERSWRIKDFQTALDFLSAIGQIAEKEGHHPDLHLVGYRNVRVQLLTHAIGGLSINDFILAAKINQIPVVLKGTRSASAAPASSSDASSADAASNSDSRAGGERKAVVHMLAGMIGSGKSTFSEGLVRKHGAVRFSPDEWVLQLYGSDYPVERFQEVGDSVKDLIWSVAKQLLKGGTDVILDFSFWFEADRKFWRSRVKSAGFESQLYFLHCDPDTLRSRLAARNARVRAGHEAHFSISLDTFNGWLPLLEPPALDELHTAVNSCAVPVGK